MNLLNFIAPVLLLSIYRVESYGLNEKFTWTRINYASTNRKHVGDPHKFKSVNFQHKNDEESQVFNNDEYIFENNIPIGANLWKNKLFITVPRRQFGIPSTLNYVLYNSTNRHNARLIPYPNSQINSLDSSSPENFVSIYRIAIDPCDRLWMVDTGVIEAPRNRTFIKKQRLIIIDLNTNDIVKTYTFKNDVLTNRTLLTMTVVDVTKESCDDAYAYFPDLAGYGLVVYSLKKDDSWRITHNYFYLEPTAGDLNIAGIKFQWTDGIFSVALSKVLRDGYRRAVFHSLMGNNLYSVSTKFLRDSALSKTYQKDGFSFIGNKGPNTHSSASDLHQSTGILFFALVNKNAIGCWNSKKPLRAENIGIVHKDDEKMIYPSDLKVRGDELIVLTNSMPIFIYSKLNYDQTNFRVWTRNVYKAIKGTVCE